MIQPSETLFAPHLVDSELKRLGVHLVVAAFGFGTDICARVKVDTDKDNFLILFNALDFERPSIGLAWRVGHTDR